VVCVGTPQHFRILCGQLDEKHLDSAVASVYVDEPRHILHHVFAQSMGSLGADASYSLFLSEQLAGLVAKGAQIVIPRDFIVTGAPSVAAEEPAVFCLSFFAATRRKQSFFLYPVR